MRFSDVFKVGEGDSFILSYFGKRYSDPYVVKID